MIRDVAFFVDETMRDAGRWKVTFMVAFKQTLSKNLNQANGLSRNLL
jgi:hypothetical protein